MNTGQTMLTLGALMLITLTILNFNRNVINIDTVLDVNRFRLEALSMLTSHIEQTSQYYFDEVTTDTTKPSELANFVTPANLGWDAGDAGEIDDMDDLHGQVVSDTGRSGVIYKVRYTVDYVARSGSSIVTSNSRTYHKRITVDIWDTFTQPLLYRETGGVKVRDTLSVSTVVSYWFYN